MDKLKKFVSRYRSTKSNPLELKPGDKVYYGIGLNIRGKFYIPGAESNTLYKLIENAFKEGLKTGVYPSLTECHPRSIYTTYNQRLAFDIDLKYNKSENVIDKETGHYFNIEDIKGLIESIATGIRWYAKESAESDPSATLTFDIMTRRCPHPDKDDDYDKDGIHVVMQNYSWDENTLLAIRNRAINHALNTNLFKNAKGDSDASFYNDVFDLSVITRNGWFMYGCTKDNTTPYLTRMVATHGPRGTITINKLKKIYMATADNIRKYSMLSVTENVYPVNKEIVDKDITDVLKQKPEIKTIADSAELNRPSKQIISDADFFSRLNDIKKYLSMLNTSRAIDHGKKVSVAYALKYFCIENGLTDENESKVLECLRDFMNRKPGRTTSFEADAQWFSQLRPREKGGATIKTLAFLARKDSPGKYAKEFIHRDIQVSTVHQLLRDARQSEVANFIKESFPYPVVCSSDSKGDWFIFNPDKHIWVKSESDSIFSHYISSLEENKLQDTILKCAKQLYPDDAEYLSKVGTKDVAKLFKNFGTLAYINSIMRLLKTRYEDDDFISKFNSDYSNVAFTNGVLELNTGVFRDGLPEDMLTSRCEYEYTDLNIPLECVLDPADPEFSSWNGKDDDDNIIDAVRFVEYSMDHKDFDGIAKFQKDYSVPDEFVQVIKVFSQIISDVETRHVILDEWARELSGQPARMLIYHIGRGGNGKSLTGLYKQYVFGSRAGTISGNTFTERRASPNAANPELYKCKDATSVSCEEMDSGDHVYINNAIIKWLLSGNMSAIRQLYGTIVEKVFNWNLHAYVNTIPPPLDPDDGGYERRISIVKYNSYFVTDINEPKFSRMSRVFQRDDRLAKPEYYTPMIPILSFLICKYYYPKAKNNIFRPSKDMKLATGEYWANVSIFGRYFRERVQRDNSEDAMITEQSFYEDFRQWCIDNIPHKPPVKGNFIKAVVKEFGQPKSKRTATKIVYWPNYRLLPRGTLTSYDLMDKEGTIDTYGLSDTDDTVNDSDEG